MRASDLWPLWVFLLMMVILIALGAYAGDPYRDRCLQRGYKYIKSSEGYECVKNLEVWK